MMGISIGNYLNFCTVQFCSSLYLSKAPRIFPTRCNLIWKRSFFLTSPPLGVGAMYKCLWFLLFSIGLCCLLVPARAQSPNAIADTVVSCSNTDSSANDSRFRKNKWLHNIFQQVYGSIQRSNPETFCDSVYLEPADALLLSKSEAAFKPYEGRIIRHISIKLFGFDRSFIDTSKRLTNLASKAADALHRDTRPWVVRNHLFIRENTPLNIFLVADNERFLRSLDFIQDARILVDTASVSQDSVDLVVYTKDLFSIKAVTDAGFDRSKLRLSENNFLGQGQRLQGTFLYDPKRNPQFGWEALYSRSSIGGSFVNATVAYTNINTGRSIGKEDEWAVYTYVEKPLVSPFSTTAGALEWSINRARNTFQIPATEYYNYAYSTVDAWAGVNLGIKHFLKKDTNYRDRKFLSLRYFDYHFSETPTQVGVYYDYLYNSKKALLAQLTLFRQEFIKTQYIYGFGVTEDIPYGYNLSATAGWWRQLNLDRPYAGVDGSYSIVTRSGAFRTYFMRVGGFLYNQQAQDAVLALGVSYFSKLYEYRGSRTRGFFKASFTRLYNRTTREPLRINNDEFGLRFFNRDSVIGSRRLSLQNEIAVYLPGQWQGFRFAPFIYTDVSLLTPAGTIWYHPTFYPGIGGGIRTRNPNLIFGTIELRGIYLPRTNYSKPQFRLDLRSDLRYRYSSNYVHRPDVVQYNQ